MTNEEKIQYRFSGYQLPKIELDETGHTYYYIVGVHPYYTSQPMYWQNEAFTTDTPVIGNRRVYKPPQGGSGGNAGLPPTPSTRNKLYCMMKF